MKKTTVINLFGGPGVGKSTTAASIFAHLKKKGVDCELVTEYAKSRVWEEATKTLDNQVYVFGKQFNKMYRLSNKVECIITDSPIINSMLYNSEFDNLDNLVMECFDKFDNINIFLKRNVDYNENGRMQTLKEAEDCDNRLKHILDKHSVEYIELDPLGEVMLDTIDNILV